LVLDAGDRFRYGADAVSLGRDRTYALSLRHFFVTAAGARAGWTIRTIGYSYGLLAGEGRELLAYHWHAAGPSPVVSPHLHLGAALLRPELARPFGRAHWPTGHVTLTELLRVAIVDLGVEPLRDDWAARLAEAEAMLRASLG
jgi:hypothetical protein